jgi:NAD(P) transhydrogenase
MRNRVDLIQGHGRFVDPHTLVEVEDGRGERTPSAAKHRDRHRHQAGPPAGVEFDEDRVLDSDGILDLKSHPASMVVVGAGVIGIEYASMFAALGTKVTVVEKRDGCSTSATRRSSRRSSSTCATSR